jgi:hypothetical protein
MAKRGHRRADEQKTSVASDSAAPTTLFTGSFLLIANAMEVWNPVCTPNHSYRFDFLQTKITIDLGCHASILCKQNELQTGTQT